jgi:hypothetical protein
VCERRPFPGRVVFGGPLSPLGWSVGFVEASPPVVLDAMQRHRSLGRVDPIEENIRELRAQGVHVETHYGPLAPREKQRPTYRITELGREPVLDQLGRLDPLQTPPLRELVISVEPGWTAHFTNDHLGSDSDSWAHNLCEALGCRADVERYRARRIQDRFNRQVLVEYLAAFGLDPDEPDRYGEGALVETLAKWDARTSSIAATQREYGIIAGS